MIICLIKYHRIWLNCKHYESFDILKKLKFTSNELKISFCENFIWLINDDKDCLLFIPYTEKDDW